MRKSVKIVSAAVIVILVAAIIVVAMTGSQRQQPTQSTSTIQQTQFASASNLTLSLTDPPTVPAGTNSLVISYSSLAVHSTAQANSSAGWTTLNGSGTVDLMSLVNVSQVIGTGKLPSNLSINMVRFQVDSATITVNGTPYTVTLPSNQITATLTSSNRLSADSSVLVDFTPTVVTIYTQNSTVFVLVPSVKAVFVGNARVHANVVGERTALNLSVRNEFERQRANITIKSESLSVSGNRTSLSITVQNNANRSVSIKHVMLVGNLSVTVSATAVPSRQREGSITTINSTEQQPTVYKYDNGSNGSLSGSKPLPVYVLNDTNSNSSLLILSHNSTYNNTVALNNDFKLGEREGVQLVANVTKLRSNSTLNQSFENEVSVAIMVKRIRALNFLVNSNGTLALPFSEQDFENQGFNLSAGSSATLTFNGPIVEAVGHMRIVPVLGSTYRLTVQGTDGSSATANVTVS